MDKQNDDRHGDDIPSAAPPALVRPRRSRLRTIAGVTGLAAILGSGAYFTTTWIVDGNDEQAHEVTAVGTHAPQSPASPEPIASGASARPTSAETTSGNEAMKAEPSFEEPADRVRKAREAAAEDGVKVTRPLPVKEDNPTGEAALAAAKEVSTGSAREGGATRVITVRGDLTGQRELGWVAGGIEKHGKVSCSQRFKLYNEQEPKTRPSLLVCWRTSAKRSVIVVDTKIGGRPPVSKSLAIIDREWGKLG